MTQDSFSLGGWTYYQQLRKCGKAGCKCNDGEQHGPYWYRRNLRTSKVEYVGKHLPEGVAPARFAVDSQRADIQATIWMLHDQARSLQKLARGERLDMQDRANAEDLGFANCLVSPEGSRATQDGKDHLVSEPAPAVTQDKGQ